jgi:hypothetical protein
VISGLESGKTIKELNHRNYTDRVGTTVFAVGESGTLTLSFREITGQYSIAFFRFPEFFSVSPAQLVTSVTANLELHGVR